MITVIGLGSTALAREEIPSHPQAVVPWHGMQCGGNARPCQTFPLQKRFALLQDCSGRKSERLVEPNIRECDGLDGCCSFSGTIGMASVVGCSATMKGALHAHIIARYDDCA